MTPEEERWARGIAGEWGYGPEYLAPLEITIAHHLRLALEEIDRLRATVAEERERAAGWLRLAFTAIDRHVPISQVPDGLDDAREFLAGFRRARGRNEGAGA
jgi:hypothetical protein